MDERGVDIFTRRFCLRIEKKKIASSKEGRKGHGMASTRDSWLMMCMTSFCGLFPFLRYPFWKFIRAEFALALSLTLYISTQSMHKRMGCYWVDGWRGWCCSSELKEKGNTHPYSFYFQVSRASVIGRLTIVLSMSLHLDPSPLSVVYIYHSSPFHYCHRDLSTFSTAPQGRNICSSGGDAVEGAWCSRGSLIVQVLIVSG